MYVTFTVPGVEAAVTLTLLRLLNEGLAYHKGGELFAYNEKDADNLNGKDISSMNETECQAYLDKAIEEEDYELAEKLRKQLEKFRE